jgi:hypothetical protein
MQRIGVERFGVKVDSNTISISPEGEDRPDKGDSIAEEMSAKGKVSGHAILVRRNPLPSIVTQDMVQASDSKPFNDQDFVYVGFVEMIVKDYNPTLANLDDAR